MLRPGPQMVFDGAMFPADWTKYGFSSPNGIPSPPHDLICAFLRAFPDQEERFPSGQLKYFETLDKAEKFFNVRMVLLDGEFAGWWPR